MQQCYFDGIVQFSLWIKPVSGRISLLWKNACLVHHTYLVTVCELTISGKTILPLFRLSQLCIIKTNYNLLVEWFCLSCFSCVCEWVCVCVGWVGGGGEGVVKRTKEGIQGWDFGHADLLIGGHTATFCTAVDRWGTSRGGQLLCWNCTIGTWRLLVTNWHMLPHVGFTRPCSKADHSLFWHLISTTTGSHILLLAFTVHAVTKNCSIPWQQQFSLAVDWPPNTCTFKDSHVNTTGCSRGQAWNYMTPSDAWRWCNSLPDPTETHYTYCSHVTVPETIWHCQMLGGDVTVYLIQQKLIIHTAVMSLCLKLYDTIRCLVVM